MSAAPKTKQESDEQDAYDEGKAQGFKDGLARAAAYMEDAACTEFRRGRDVEAKLLRCFVEAIRVLK